MKAPRTRVGSVLAGVAALLPLAAVVAFAGIVPAKPLNEAELASERATATETSMLCPGPVFPESADGVTTSDAQFQDEGASTKVGFRAIALEPNSNLLFGQRKVSETSLDEQGNPRRPATSVVNRDGSDLRIDQTDGVGDFSLVGTYGVTQPFTVTSTSSSQTQPVLDTVQGMITPSGDYRSFILARCESVAVDRTFVGISTKAGNDATLVLYNPGDRPARAVLTIADTEGVVDTPSASDVVIAPGGTERVTLQSLAPDRERIALRVNVDGSALGMHVEVAERDGLTPMGAEVLSAQLLDTRQVIPGVRIGGEYRGEVTVFNSSGVPADATVRVIAADGTQVGDDLTLSDIAAGGTATAPLSAPAGLYTLRVESEAQIGAVARSSVAGKDLPGDTVGSPVDFAAHVPAATITNSSLLALGNRASGGVLSLYAELDTGVQVVGITPDGALTSAVSRTVREGEATQITAKDFGVSEGDLVGFVVVPEASGVLRGAWTQTIDTGGSGPMISTVVLPDNNVAATGMDVRARE